MRETSAPGLCVSLLGTEGEEMGCGEADPARGHFHRPRKEGCPRIAAACSPQLLSPRLPLPGGGGGGGEPQGTCRSRETPEADRASHRLSEVGAGCPNEDWSRRVCPLWKPRGPRLPPPALPAEPQCPLSTFLAVSASLRVSAAPFPSSPFFALCCPQTSPPPCLCESLMKK